MTLQDAIQDVRFGPAVLAVGTAGIVAELALIGVAARRLIEQRRVRRLALGGDWRAVAASGRTTPWAEVAAAMAPFAVVVMMVASMQAARSQILPPPHFSLPAVAAGGRAAQLSSAIAGDLNAAAPGIWCFWLAAVLATVAGGLAAAARLRTNGLRWAATLPDNNQQTAMVWARYPGPAPAAIVLGLFSLVWLTLGPLIRAIFSTISDQIKTFGTIRTVAVLEKVATLEQSFERGRYLVATATSEATVGALVAVTFLLILDWLFGPGRIRAERLPPDAPKPPRGRTVMLASTLLCVAAGMLPAASLFGLENGTPWPPDHGGERLLIQHETPQLDGPDEVQRVPVVTLSAAGLSLNGGRLSGTADLIDQLNKLAQATDPTANEGRPLDVLLLCAPDTPTTVVAPVLDAVAAGGFDGVMFGFVVGESVKRPLFGTLHRQRVSGARAHLREADTNAVVIDPRQLVSFGRLAERIVAERRENRTVRLRTGGGIGSGAAQPGIAPDGASRRR